MKPVTRRAVLAGAGAAGGLLSLAGLGLQSSSPDWTLPTDWQQKIPEGPGSGRPPLLFDQWPELTKSIPWLSLGHFPTPLSRLSSLEQDLGFSGEIWLKREDLSSPLYGGNKVRKLEFVLADALAQGADTLVSVGGIGSHQCCATARFAAAMGMEHHSVMFPQPVTDHVLNNLRYNLWAKTIFHYNEGYAGAVLSIRSTLKELRRQGKNPYFVYIGTSTPLGVLGFVDMMLELKTQIEANEVPTPDRMYTAAGSCGTLAGLLLGRKLVGLDQIDIVGVRITDRIGANAVMLDYLTDAAAANLHRADPTFPQLNVGWSTISFEHKQFGGTYGLPTIPGTEAIARLEQLEQISLEATYTAKTMAAVIADTAKPENAGKKLMMVHTYNAVPYPQDMPPGTDLPDNLQWVNTAERAQPVAL